MTYAERLQATRRLYILRILAEAPAYEANDEILDAMLNGLGAPGARAETRAALRWLAEQSPALCRIEELGEGFGPEVLLAALTEAGLDAARGLVEVPGLRKPSPRLLRRQAWRR